MPDCLICKNAKPKNITRFGENFDNEKVVFCSNCQVAWLQKSSVLAQRNYYQNNTFSSEFRGFTIPPVNQIKLREVRADRRLALLKNNGVFNDNKNYRLLEVGCSFGAFLKKLRYQKNIVTKGIELSSSMVEYSNEYLSDSSIVVQESLSEKTLKEFMPNIICIYQVIEHIENIIEFMQILSKVSTETLLVVEFPDLEQALRHRKRLGMKYFQRSHLYDFSAYALVLLFAKFGFFPQQIIYGKSSQMGDKNTTILFSKKESEIKIKQPNLFLQLILKSTIANFITNVFKK